MHTLALYVIVQYLRGDARCFEHYTVSQKASPTFSTVTWKKLPDFDNFWYEYSW